MGPLSIGPRRPRQMAGPLDVHPPMEKPADSMQMPPNLSDAEDANVSCGTCRHWSEDGACSKYSGYPTQTDRVCDAYEPMEGAGEEMGEGQKSMPGMEG